MSGIAAKSKKTASRKATPASWKKGQSGNPKGRPPTGESWSELIAQVGNMTGDEVASFAGVLGREFSKLPQGVTVKTLTVIRVFGALLNDPQPGLLNAFMERVEGKVPLPIASMTDDDLRKFIAQSVGVNLSGDTGSSAAGIDVGQAASDDSAQQ